MLGQASRTIDYACSQENGSAVPSMLHSMLEESGENADALRSKLTASVPAVAYNGKI